MSGSQTTDIASAVDFLKRRFEDIHAGYAVLGFIKDGIPTHDYINLQAPDRWEGAAMLIRRHADTHDCYAAVAVFKETKRRNQATGKNEFRSTEMIAFVPALYLERDEHPYPDTFPPASLAVATSNGRFQDYFDLREPIDAETAGRYLRRFTAAAGIGNQAVDAARLLRLPGTINRKPNRNGEMVVVVEDSHAVYALDDFSHLPDVQPRPGPGYTSDGSNTIPNGQRNATMASLAGTMRRRGMSEGAIFAALREENATRCVPPLDDDELRRVAASVSRYKPAPPDPVRISRDHASAPPPDVYPETAEIPTTRPRIDAGNHDLPDVTRRAWAALQAANDPPRLFRHAGGVARLDVDEDGRPLLRPATTRTLRHEVAEAADWYVIKKHGPEPAVPPQHITENMLEVPTPPVPLLERIAHAPFFAPDWTLVTEPGYDAASRTYLLMDDLPRAPIPTAPSGEDLRQARDLIVNELFADFPFVSDADRANAVALTLLPYARPAIPGATPLHLIEASTPGTGKVLLADVATRPAVGTHIGVMTQPRDSDEMRKRLTARLREGAPVILLDNIVHTLDSGDLAAALTADTWTDRILGSTETISVPIRCVWVGSGNNVAMTTELARRLIRIRLDAMIDRPWQRTGFRHENLIKWADEHRAELVRAALVIIQAWVAAGRPEAMTTLGSFERWSAMMGGILDNAGIAGFLTNLDAFYEEADLEGAIWRQFIGLWWEQHGEKEVTVADLFPLTDAVESLDLGKGSDKAQRTAFGMLLTKQRDRVFGDFRIVFARVAHKQKKWRLVPTAIQLLIPPDPPAGGVSAEQGPPAVYPCDKRGDTDGGGPEGAYPNATHEGIPPFYSPGDAGQKVPQDPPCDDSRTDPAWWGKDKPIGGPFPEGPPDAARRESGIAAKLAEWATAVLADDWGDGAPPAWVVNAATVCGIAAGTSEREAAAMILAAMNGGR